MNVKVNPCPLSGELRAMPSKSDTHRKLICAALSDGPTKIELFGSLADISASASAGCTGLSADISATIGALEALGADISIADGGVLVQPIKKTGGAPHMDCGESGSTLRFLLPVAAALYDRAYFTGSGRLPRRPLSQLMEAMSANGVGFSAPSLPFEVSGRLNGGCFRLPGDVSSQFITGLMLALPLLEGDSEIVLTSPLQSAGYVELTRRVLGSFGVRVLPASSGWVIPGGQRFTAPERTAVSGDWSSAAFFLCAGALGAPVTVTGLNLASPQGDKEIMNILTRFGAKVAVSGSSVTVSPGELRGCEVDMRDIPDLLPVLAVIAACAKGESRFTGAGRLRLKESDRLFATAAMLSALGASVTELPDGLIVRGGELKGGKADGFGDHRIVMAAAIASIRCSDPVTICGAEAVYKSYPAFFDDLATLKRRKA